VESASSSSIGDASVSASASGRFRDTKLVSERRSMRDQERKRINIVPVGGGDDPRTRKEDETGEAKNRQVMRRRSYDSTLFGLDVFEGLEMDYKARLEREHLHPILRYIPVIDPAWKFQQNRDLVSVIIVLYSVYFQMFAFAFVQTGPSLQEQYAVVYYLELFCTIYFWFDIILCFTTAIYDAEDDLITDRKKIIVTYVKGWFWIDLISNLELGVGALALLKVLRLARFPRMIVRWANLGVSTMALNIFKISVMTLTAGHFFACLFFLVAVADGHTDESWTRKDFGHYTLFDWEPTSCNSTDSTQTCVELVQYHGLETMYIASLYFAYATLTTVGYGDISATTTLERGVALIALSIGSAIFAGIVGTMSTLIDTMDELEEMKLNKRKHIQQFIKSHHFPENIRTRIKKYYELHFQYLKKELDLLEELSPALRHECMHHIYAKILLKVPFLQDSPQIVQSAVIACVKPVLCCEKDYLVIEGQVLNHIFLVASGAVEVINNKGLVSRTYGVGSFFGEKCAFHSHYLSTVSYRAKVDSEVLTIERNEFVDLLNTYEAFGETFMMICQKREDHKKGHLKNGQTRMTGKLSKNAASMVRPVTPPPGTTWKPLDKGSSKSVFEKCQTGGTLRVDKGPSNAIGQLQDPNSNASTSRIQDVFEDESLPALLDKLQYNLGSQLDDIQDHLDHLEDRLETLEMDQQEPPSPHYPTAQNISFLDQPRKLSTTNTIGTASTVDSSVSTGSNRVRQGNIVRPEPIRTAQAQASDGQNKAEGKEEEEGENQYNDVRVVPEQRTPRKTVRRSSRILSREGLAREGSRFVMRENSRIRHNISKRNLQSSPHEY